MTMPDKERLDPAVVGELRRLQSEYELSHFKPHPLDEPFPEAAAFCKALWDNRDALLITAEQSVEAEARVEVLEALLARVLKHSGQRIAGVSVSERLADLLPEIRTALEASNAQG